MMPSLPSGIARVFRGAVCSPGLRLGEISLEQRIVGVGQDGRVAFSFTQDSAPEAQSFDNIVRAYRDKGVPCTVLSDEEYLLPGFVDTHYHAPQYSFTGTATELPLFRWLEEYAFPSERRVQDLQWAEHLFSTAVKRGIDSGSTTCMYYASLFYEPSVCLVDQVERAGQRGIIGKVSMDRNSPADYVETTADGISKAEKFIVDVKSRNSSRLLSAITPRFIPTCSKELLAGLGELAAAHGVHIQSHVSESEDEVAFSATLHPEVMGRDVQIFEEFGLLRRGTVLAHGVHLNAQELKTLGHHGAAIAHCPLSNFFFAGGVFPVRLANAMGVAVGLATDVSGGYCPNMLTAIRQAVVASKALALHTLPEYALPPLLLSKDGRNWGKGSLQKPDEGVSEPPDLYQPLDYRDGLRLATRGGARALNMEQEIGHLEPGAWFDALLVDTSKGPFHVFDSDDQWDRLQKFVNLGDDRNIVNVWVAGDEVKHV